MLKALEKLDPKLLPAAFQTRFGDASHWCCSNMQPVNTEQRTRVDHAIHTVSYILFHQFSAESMRILDLYLFENIIHKGCY